MARSKTIFSTLAFLFTAIALLALTGCNATGRSWESADAAPAIDAPGAVFDQSLQQTPPSELPPVKVALLVPLTGRQASLGQSLLNAAQMALFDVGYNNFELLPRDTGGTAAGAAKAASEAVQGGAQLILGPVFSEEVRAAKPALRGTSVNMIAFSTDWELADSNTFVMGFLPFDQIERITNYAATQNIRSIGVIAPANNYGRTVIPAYQTMASRSNIQTPQAITVQPGTPGATAVLQKFAQSANFQAVFMPFGGDAATQVASTLQQSGMSRDIRLLGTGLFDDTILASRPEMAGALFAAPAPASRAAFENRFMQTYNYPAPRIATLSYDATALATSLARNGADNNMRPFDRTTILNPNGFAGLDGIFRFRQNGLAERGLAVLEFQNGKITVRDPAPATFQAPTQ